MACHGIEVDAVLCMFKLRFFLVKLACRGRALRAEHQAAHCIRGPISGGTCAQQMQLPMCTMMIPSSLALPLRMPLALALMGLLAFPSRTGVSASYWDTVPVGIHGGVRHRPQSDIASLVKFSVVVVDPVEGPSQTRLGQWPLQCKLPLYMRHRAIATHAIETSRDLFTSE